MSIHLLQIIIHRYKNRIQWMWEDANIFVTCEELMSSSFTFVPGTLLRPEFNIWTVDFLEIFSWIALNTSSVTITSDHITGPPAAVQSCCWLSISTYIFETQPVLLVCALRRYSNYCIIVRAHFVIYLNMEPNRCQRTTNSISVAHVVH